ncbi:Tetraspanin-5, partial [Branchiostoma belcheri]
STFRAKIAVVFLFFLTFYGFLTKLQAMARDTEVSCLVKYLVFGFNVIFWLAGGFILGIGLWAWFEKGTFDNIAKVANVPVDPVLIFVVVGAIMFILGFSGCVGALRENIILLRFFSVVLGIIFLWSWLWACWALCTRTGSGSSWTTSSRQTSSTTGMTLTCRTSSTLSSPISSAVEGRTSTTGKTTSISTAH